MKFSKKILSLLLVAVMLFSTAPLNGLADVNWLGVMVSAIDATGECGDNASYSFNKETGELIISGTGAIYSGAFSWCDDIKSVVIGEGITSIGNNAFSWSRNITSVKLCEGITTIEYEAFSNCASLAEINIPNSLTNLGYRAFDTCLSLSGVNIGDNVTAISSTAFRECGSLTYVKLGNNVESIGYGSFSGCTNLKTIYITDSVKNINGCAFDDSGITDIYYEGTEDQWAKIEISDGVLDGINVRYEYKYCQTHKNIINVNTTEATCTTVGYTEGKYCQDCENWISGHKLIRKKLHSDEKYDGICDTCLKVASDLFVGESNEVWTFAGYNSEYRFIPEYSGTYHFDLEYAQNIQLYDVENKSWYSSGEWEIYAELKEGNTYLISISVDDSYCITNLNIYFLESTEPTTDPTTSEDETTATDPTTSGDETTTTEPITTEKEEPTTEPIDTTDDCSCICHKTGFMSIIYRIMLFFWKLFKTNQVCSCGIAHY